MMTKSEIRSYHRELRDKLTQEELGMLSAKIRERLFQTEEYKNCNCLLTYVSFRSEADTHEIIRNSINIGKSVFAPRVESHVLEFYRISNLEGLIQSKFGVLEPLKDETLRFQIPGTMQEKNTAEKEEYGKDYHTSNSESVHQSFSKQHLNLMLLPGLAFDLLGNRIGYGAGYYDRYLAAHRSDSFMKIALAYDFQVIDAIEAEPFDIKADLIITPTRIINVIA